MLRKVFGGLAAFACLVPSTLAGTFSQVTSFGSNPTGVQMWVYKPTKQISKPPLIVAIHWCSGTAEAMYQGSPYASLAETYGYIVIYPDAPDSGGCWDVHTNATLTHDKGGDSLAIASMVRYAISNYGVDSSRVFATGLSSGAMMTNVLLGAYPDLFKAATAYAGVPYGCFAGDNMWNSDCANGKIIKTAQQWGDLVRAGYPGYSGARPKFKTYHGTQDTVLYYQNLAEQTKQWSNVLGVSFSKNITNSPVSGWTTMVYGDGTKFVAVSEAGVDHSAIQIRGNEDLEWFGITEGSSTTTLATSTVRTTTTAAPPTTTTSSGGGSIPQWGQCGGIGWTGSGTCVSGTTCKVVNDYYYQCQ